MLWERVLDLEVGLRLVGQGVVSRGDDSAAAEEQREDEDGGSH